MMAEDAPRRLGRGLAALIGDMGGQDTEGADAAPPRRLPIAFLRPNPRNPRRAFAEADLADLTESVRAKGVVQPIIVRPFGGDTYEIIAGERRWRAAGQAGLHDVPVVVIEASDREAMEIALVENIQRADLNALEEAGGYEKLIAEFGYSQTELAAVIGKSRSHVANTLRLQKLPEKVKAYMADGRLSAGHARALIGLPDAEAVAERIVREGLSVRQVEQLGQDETPERRRAPRPSKDADIRALEQTLADVLGLRVALNHRGEKGGEIRIGYKTLDQLDDVCRRLRD